MHIPIAGMLAERARLQRLRDAHRQRERACRITGGRAFRQGRHQARTGIGMIFFGDRKLGKLFLEAGAISRPARPCLRRLDQSAPFVGPRAGAGEKLIDPTFLSLLRHGGSPNLRSTVGQT